MVRGRAEAKRGVWGRPGRQRSGDSQEGAAQGRLHPTPARAGLWEGDPDQTWLLWKGLNLDAGNILGFAQRQGRRDIYVFALGLYRLFFLIHKAGEGGLEGEEQRRPSQ